MRMTRTAVVLMTVGTLACAPMSAEMARADTYFGFTIGVRNAPPPPRVYFRSQPDVIVVPGSSVYVVEESDCDMFRYGGYWYAENAGYWYRASRYSGPFVAVDVRVVPRPVLTVPARHWKHHPHGGPPGQQWKSHGHGHDK